MNSDIYTQDGVNVEVGDDASSIAAKFCRQTYDFSPVAKVNDYTLGSFRGPRGVDLHNEFRLKPYELACAPDGVGTKVVLHDAAKSYHLAAYDLIAMTSFDLVRWGGLPVYFTSVLDVSSLGNGNKSDAFKATIALYKGAVDAAKDVGMIILNGETAELGAQVASENPNAILKFNWGGSAQGLYHKDRIILGNTLEAGQVVMVMKENGFRSNGISSVRAAFSKQFGYKWYDYSGAEEYIKMAAVPSVLYDKFFCTLNGWYGKENTIKVHSLIHLSGGSFESKFGRDILFKRGLSANLEDLWEPTEIMTQCAEWRGMDDKTIYKTWNGGQGALAVIDESDVNRFIELAKLFGHEAKAAGTIIDDAEPYVRIKSKFSGEEIIFR